MSNAKLDNYEHHQRHCDNCINPNTCSSRFLCDIVECSNKCGQRCHECKLQEHLDETCPNSFVNCLNHTNGCRLKLKRSQLATHLSSCVASVVVCFHSYASRDHIQKLSINDKRRKFDSTIIRNMYCKHTCSQLLRRDEFSDHWTLIHNFLVPQLDYLFASCPYREYGCQVGTEKVNFFFGKFFNLAEKNRSRHHLNAQLTYGGPNFGFRFDNMERELACLMNGNENQVQNWIDLPFDIHCSILSHLDSDSIFNLSLVSKGFRSVCELFVQYKGTVTPKWIRTEDQNSGSKWMIDKYAYSFSRHSQTPVFITLRTEIEPDGNFNQHVQTCPHKRINEWVIGSKYELRPAIPVPQPKLKPFS